MAVGSGDYGILHEVAGVRMAAVSAGIKKAGRLDVVLFALNEEAVTAGVFTRNAFCAAPVTLAKAHLLESKNHPSYLLINTGNANAGTGEPGMQAALSCCVELGVQTNHEASAVLPFSTGVIGELLPAAKITAVLNEALEALQPNAWDKVALGIMTTDTRPKAASRQIEVGGATVTITGITKGAGMIKPDMATMLGFVFTDARMTAGEVQQAVKAASDKSFNRVTVDGDTSTNDSCILTATGCSGVVIGQLSSGEQTVFYQALEEIFVTLATAIIRDGEGATKFVTVNVEQGASVQECLKVGYAVAESPLVKTALFASDPNWGRILAAVGRAGLEDLNLSGVDIYLDDVCIVSQGARDSTYLEADGQRVLKQEEFAITIRLGRGDVQETLWTCDFSHDYVSINADYRS